MSPLAPWIRLEYHGKAVYINPERPDWIVPNTLADSCLQALAASGTPEEAAHILEEKYALPAGKALITVQQILTQVETEAVAQYKGRSRHLRLTTLKECWFHLTNRCNLACGHCLFGASGDRRETLDKTLLHQGIAEAKKLGCTLFFFTGGEPFLYPDFPNIIAGLLLDEKIHAVVLTNGMLLNQHREWLEKIPKDRFHLQISLDGLEKNHDMLRGTGTFGKLMDNLTLLHGTGHTATLSVAVNSTNFHELPDIITLAAEKGAGHIHLLWHFIRGKGNHEQFISPEALLPQLITSLEQARKHDIIIDNIEALRGQVFSTPGTRHDLSNTAWESLSIGPEGTIFPSPALVDIPELRCGHLKDGLENVWKKSPVLNRLRSSSLCDAPLLRHDPLKFLTGGGDIDHSYLAGGEFVGHDPYLALHNALVLWLITTEAARYPDRPGAHILLRMGDLRHDCPAEGGHEVALTHCNCVVSLSADGGHSTVRDFYGQAAREAQQDIRNPFAPDQSKTEFIPAASKERSYGCGSPVQDAAPKLNEVVVDLGSGSGVECFMAAKAVGPKGRVLGIDMTDDMLALARQSQERVSATLGYDNIRFQKGFLEDLPIEDSFADVVISNCVINLSPDKRRTFHEIFRILKPGGRLVVSDIVTEGVVPAGMKNDSRFRGECLGGALQQVHLVAMLKAVGFTGIYLVKRFPYRRENSISFFSLTFQCVKPDSEHDITVVYRGPQEALTLPDGTLLLNGKTTRIHAAGFFASDEAVMILDHQGAVTNLTMQNSCCSSVEPTPRVSEIKPIAPGKTCCTPAQSTGSVISIRPKPFPSAGPVKNGPMRHGAGCMACGSEITYLESIATTPCYFCGRPRKTNALCTRGHFICDDCHQEEGLAAIQLICVETREQDMLKLLQIIRRHPAIPMHGPEHHAMMPGIILATYRNRGGDISRETILSGIERGGKVPGGTCGFWGNCGAAAGVGIGFATLLHSTPLTPEPRKLAQTATARVLTAIAAVEGSRCCQRETVTALKEAARISREILPVPLLAEADFVCAQFKANKECIRERCLLWPANRHAMVSI